MLRVLASPTGFEPVASSLEPDILSTLPFYKGVLPELNYGDILQSLKNFSLRFWRPLLYSYTGIKKGNTQLRMFPSSVIV